MPDAIFAHPRLALVYDAFDGPRDDLAAYVAIAGELGADRVLDVGCGTGCLAIALAGTGRTVTGVDPAAASLDVARSKDGSAASPGFTAMPPRYPAASADLAVMTGNVAQVFLTDEDWDQVLQAIGAALGPRGYLVFETRRPGRRAWEEWAAEPARSAVTSRAAAWSSGASRSPPWTFRSSRSATPTPSWPTARSSRRTPRCGSAAATRWKRAWPPGATGCWRYGTPRPGRGFRVHRRAGQLKTASPPGGRGAG